MDDIEDSQGKQSGGMLCDLTSGAKPLMLFFTAKEGNDASKKQIRSAKVSWPGRLREWLSKAACKQ